MEVIKAKNGLKRIKGLQMLLRNSGRSIVANICIYETNPIMLTTLTILTALILILNRAKTIRDENEAIYQRRSRDTLRETDPEK